MSYSNIKKKNLDEITEYINRGITPRYTEKNGIRILNQRCIRNYTVGFEKSRFTDPNIKKIPKEKLLKKYDVLVNSTGVGTLGRVGQIKSINEPITVDSHVTIVRPSKEINPIFFGYAMILNQPIIEQMGEGATGQTELSRARLRYNLFIKIPLEHSQTKIASILSKYDYLIENNFKRIKILKKMAEMIYREWFVNFNFPQKESFKMVDSEMGSLPYGWEVRKIKEIIKNRISVPKKVKKSDYLIHGRIPCIDQSIDFIGGYTNDIDSIFSEFLPIVVFGDHTRILKFIDFPFACGADGVKLLYPKHDSISPEYLYYSLININLSNQHYARHFKFLKEKKILIPQKEMVLRFNKIIIPIMNEIQLLRNLNLNLRKTRDLLLPKLIDGVIDVSKLNISISAEDA